MKDKLIETFPLMKDKLSSPNATYYPDYYYLCDQLTGELYEGAPKRNNFSTAEWDVIMSVQLRSITKSFDEFSLKLFMSRNFRRPLREMKAKVASVLAG